MYRPLYLLGFGYLAICGVVVLRHRAGPLRGPEHAPVAATFGGSAGEWFAAIKPYCNAVEVELAQRQHPAPSTLDGHGLSAACYALGGKIDLARATLDRLPAADRAQAAGIRCPPPAILPLPLRARASGRACSWSRTGTWVGRSGCGGCSAISVTTTAL